MIRWSIYVQCSLHRLETSAAEIGLTINYNKTKVMHLGQTSPRHVRFANGDPVDSCDKFEYLGVTTSNAETVFRSRLSKAWAAATNLRSIFNAKANDSIKIGLCRSAVKSIRRIQDTLSALLHSTQLWNEYQVGTTSWRIRHHQYNLHLPGVMCFHLVPHMPRLLAKVTKCSTCDRKVSKFVFFYILNLHLFCFFHITNKVNDAKCKKS